MTGFFECGEGFLESKCGFARRQCRFSITEARSVSRAVVYGGDVWLWTSVIVKGPSDVVTGVVMVTWTLAGVCVTVSTLYYVRLETGKWVRILYTVNGVMERNLEQNLAAEASLCRALMRSSSILQNRLSRLSLTVCDALMAVENRSRRSGTALCMAEYDLESGES